MLENATTTRPQRPRLADPKPLSRPPVDFHPQVLGDDAPPDAREALQSMYESWERLHVSQHDIEDHKRLADVAKRTVERVLAGAERSIGRLKTQREAIHQRINEVVRPLAHRDPVGVEIRQHFKTTRQPFGEVDAAIRAGDLQSVRAVLGAPHYLSGLDLQQQAVILDRARQVFTPDDYSKLRALDAASDKVEAFAQRFTGELAKFIRERQDADTAKLQGLEK